MGDDEAFIAAIASAPDDQLPPLVYADWLDDRADPRGRLLRVWVDLSWRASHASAGFCGLVAEYRRLWQAAEPSWRSAFGAARPWVDARLAEELCRGYLRYIEQRRPRERGVIAAGTGPASDPFPPGWLVQYWVPFHSTGSDPRQWARWILWVEPALGWVYGVATAGPLFLQLDIAAGEGASF